MKKESENYKIVSVVTVLMLFAAFVVLTVAGLSHAFNMPSGGSEDLGYVATDGEQ